MATLALLETDMTYDPDSLEWFEMEGTPPPTHDLGLAPTEDPLDDDDGVTFDASDGEDED